MKVNADDTLPPLVPSLGFDDILKYKKHLEDTEPQLERLITELRRDLSSQVEGRTPLGFDQVRHRS